MKKKENKEQNVLFNDALNIFLMVIWRLAYDKVLIKRKPTAATIWAIFFN